MSYMEPPFFLRLILEVDIIKFVSLKGMSGRWLLGLMEVYMSG